MFKYTSELLDAAFLMKDFLPSSAKLMFSNECESVIWESSKKITQAHTKPPCHSHAVSNTGAPPDYGNVA